MAKTLTDILIERQKRKEKYFKNWRFYIRKIKKYTKEILGEKTKVFLFGSFFKKEWSPESDIDVLIVSENLPEDFNERGKIRTKNQIKSWNFFTLPIAFSKTRGI